MAKYATFRELIAWQKGMDLTEGVYRETWKLRDGETYGIGRQLRRAALAIPSNVAEGFSRHSRGAYRAHVAIALGSVAEVQTQLEVCRRLSLVPEAVPKTLEQLALEVGRLLYGLWRSLAVASVCYSLVLAGLVLGLGPWALGLLVK
jgi:four helix bundle protein